METRPENALERAIATLLVPLVRLLMKRGVVYGQLAEWLKRAYLEAARRHFAEPGRKLSISRIALLTGLTRKEASRLQGEDAAAAAGGDDRRRVSRLARVLTAWVREPEFQDGRGAAASLPFDAESGPSVSELVRRHGADVTPRALLDELVRVGAVRELKDGRYRPVERSYVPTRDPEEKLSILGTDVADLIASIHHNLEAPAEAAFYQRKVAYDNLPAEFLPALRDIVRREAQNLLEQLDGEMSRHDLDVQPRDGVEGGRRAMVGIYYFEDDRNEDARHDDQG